MKLKKKIILGAAAGLLLALILTVVIAAFFLGDVIKAGVNAVGPKVTQTPLSVNSVLVRPLAGYVYMDGFALGNPEEYRAKSTNALTIGKVVLSVAPLSALGDKLVINNIEVRDLVVDYQGNPFGKYNIKVILDNISTFTGAEKGGVKPAGQPAPPQKPGKKLQVDNVVVSGARINFNGMPLVLPDIQLKNLGTGPEGITPAGLIKDLISEVNIAALKEIGKSAGSAGKAIGDGASKIGKSVTDLFKK